MYFLSICLVAALCASSALCVPFSPDERYCPNLSDAENTLLNSLQVTEDVHDQFVGDFIEVWGKPSNVQTCVKAHYTKVDDKTFSRSYDIKNVQSNAVTALNLVGTKITNGVYLLKKQDGTNFARMHILKADGNLISYFVCLLHERRADDEKAPKLTVVFSKLAAFKEAAGKPVEGMEATTTLIQANKALLGEISQKDTGCA